MFYYTKKGLCLPISRMRGAPWSLRPYFELLALLGDLLDPPCSLPGGLPSPRPPSWRLRHASEAQGGQLGGSGSPPSKEQGGPEGQKHPRRARN
eukprot:4525870-Alexandrium_andersonii.AAC.1